MMNSAFVIDRARGFARWLLENDSLLNAERVERAYLRALPAGLTTRRLIML